MENYNIGRFVPQCKPDGRYEEVQCGAGWEYCWCVDSTGMELTGTKTKGWPQCGKTWPHSVKLPYSSLVNYTGSMLVNGFYVASFRYPCYPKICCLNQLFQPRLMPEAKVLALFVYIHCL